MRLGTLTSGSHDILRLLSQHQGDNIWNRNSFEHALQIGLGRVILYLQDHDDAPYRDIILHACLHNTLYDEEETHGNTQYLRDIIDLSSDRDFYRQKILDKASNLTKNFSWDGYHLLHIVTTFAADGDTGARQIVYDVFNRNIGGAAALDLGIYIVDIDGLDGLLYVMDKLGPQLQVGPDYWTWAGFHLIYQVKEQTGRTDIDDILSEQRKHSPNIDAFIRAAEEGQKEIEAFRKSWRDVQNLSYEEVKAAIDQRERIDFAKWGRIADEADLVQAAQTLFLEHDMYKRLSYANIFRNRAFPFDPQPLINLIKQANRSIESGPIFTMLGNVRHPKVRTFALKLIAEEGEIGHAIGLLESNFESGDWAMIEKIAQQDLSTDDYYWLQNSVTKVFEQNPSPNAIPALVNVYEKGPCMHIRKDILKQLHSIGGMTMAIAEECRWDASPYIREWVRNGFVDMGG